MYDIHSHILPGIDDGAKTMADSVDLCRMAHDEEELHSPDLPQSQKMSPTPFTAIGKSHLHHRQAWKAILDNRIVSGW